MRWLTSILFFTILLSACQDGLQSGSEKTIEEIKADGEVSSIIRNPVTAGENVDTINVAKMVFEETSYDFQEVLEGDVVRHTFNFKNEGKVPLIIRGARSTCGCTVPEWPKDPIESGERGEIIVKFDTKGKKNKQSKPVTITANTYPAQTKVFLTGFVIPKEDN